MEKNIQRDFFFSPNSYHPILINQKFFLILCYKSFLCKSFPNHSFAQNSETVTPNCARLRTMYARERVYLDSDNPAERIAEQCVR